MKALEQAILAMTEFDAGSPKRIQHFLKVHSFARLIGLAEGLDKETQQRLELAAVVHDIGIRPAQEEYGRYDGKLQEQVGPPYARKLLEELGVPAETVDRVAFLVAHHHTITDVEGDDWQILLEADYLVNLYEKEAPADAVRNVLSSVFRTETGKRICRTMFGV